MWLCVWLCVCGWLYGGVAVAVCGDVLRCHSPTTLLRTTVPPQLRGDAMPVVRPSLVRYAHRQVAGGTSGHAAAAAGGGRGTCVCDTQRVSVTVQA